VILNYTVSGRTRDEIVKEAHRVADEFEGRENYHVKRSFHYDVRPVVMEPDGTVVIWEADVTVKRAGQR
jgi:hypothetical protein